MTEKSPLPPSLPALDTADVFDRLQPEADLNLFQSANNEPGIVDTASVICATTHDSALKFHRLTAQLCSSDFQSL